MRAPTIPPRTLIDAFGAHARAGLIPQGQPDHFHAASRLEVSEPMDREIAGAVRDGLREYGVRAALLPCWGVCS